MEGEDYTTRKVNGMRTSDSRQFELPLGGRPLDDKPYELPVPAHGGDIDLGNDSCEKEAELEGDIA